VPNNLSGEFKARIIFQAKGIEIRSPDTPFTVPAAAAPAE
jgi:hypothetical protein